MARPLRAFIYLSCMIVSLGLIVSCSTEKTYQKGVIKDFPDSLVEKPNTWRGGPMGGVLSNPIEGNVKEISLHASREAGREGKPMVYLSLDGFQRVESFPVGKAKSKKCSLVREQIFQESRLIRDEVKEICP